MADIVTTPVQSFEIKRYENGRELFRTNDLVVSEEPLEIRVGHGAGKNRKLDSVAITMRTPGHDTELAAGFLFTEGLVTSSSDIISIRPCTDRNTRELSPNIVRVELEEETPFQAIERNMFMSSSCGICGKATIENIEVACPYPIIKNPDEIPSDVVLSLPQKLRSTQTVFAHTGGIHAAALFDKSGNLILLREDVGRHNAVDKVIGHQWLKDCTPLSDCILLVSGRVGFEIAQKVAIAGVGALAAIGAPSGAAIQLLRARSIPLYGFIRDGRFNQY